MAGPCTFCRIRDGEVAAHTVLHDRDAFAFLDFRPVFPGHVLVAPQDHHATLPDLPARQIGRFFAAVQRVTSAVTEAMEADGTFVAVNNTVSQSVPHLHVHVVPRRRGDGLRGFFWPRARYRDEAEMEATAERIRARLERPEGAPARPVSRRGAGDGSGGRDAAPGSGRGAGRRQ